MRAVGEIIVDNFAGGGGASTGIEMATGRSVDIAINHDEAAIAMHKANHPDTEHYRENVWNIDPKKVVKGRPVGLAWFSPDCKHFSKAKGGKPVEKGIRGLAWVAVRWAIAVRPRVIMLENVEEFKTWGPLLEDGKPDPDKKGKTFESFVKALKVLGYEVDHTELKACDYGAPTIRKRFFLIARCDGKPIIWPEPTHGDPESDGVKKGKLMPWRTAAEIIDWSRPCPSIFNRKKPLVENTLRRIARGIQRFVLENPQPFIVRIGQTGFGGDRLQYKINRPLTTITTKAEHLLVTPFIAKHYGGGYTGPGADCNNPLPTVTTVDHNALVTAFLSKYYGETSPTEVRGQELSEPIHTISTANRFGLVTSHLVKLRGTCKDGQPVTKPMPTITAGGQHVGEVRAFLVKYYGAGIGQDVQEPLHTIPTKDRFGLVTIHGQDYQIVDIGMRMLQPHELFAAQGFPSNYIIDKDHNGNSYQKAEQVKRCGNSVPPPFAEHLVRANLPELCTGAGKTLTFERYKEKVGQLQFSM
ncbi:DNA cytosine methyltransferase [Aneurinibacillus aneurinilyticus]|uniref:DNA cytosine methyltransferase n=1 Tax=Aneurinibacillus aneurinilyticus TaxID=1391 RepID=UPI0023F4BEC2|nr:DNA cytosine methyltransferase [Aneurinibacillus aneurinilyticus]